MYRLGGDRKPQEATGVDRRRNGYRPDSTPSYPQFSEDKVIVVAYIDFLKYISLVGRLNTGNHGVLVEAHIEGD